MVYSNVSGKSQGFVKNADDSGEIIDLISGLGFDGHTGLRYKLYSEVPTFEVQYDDFSKQILESPIKAYENLQEELRTYFTSKDGMESRESESENNFVIIKERLHDRSVIITHLNTRDLYVCEVKVQSPEGEIIMYEKDDGNIGNYTPYGTILIPIQFYTKTNKYSSPGALIRSQAFRISESLRFRKKLRYKQLSNGEAIELWPELKTLEFGYITPYQYSNRHRYDTVDFRMFDRFYKEWEKYSRERHGVIKIPHIRKKD